MAELRRVRPLAMQLRKDSRAIRRLTGCTEVLVLPDSSTLLT
jgi:hypothetical protein